MRLIGFPVVQLSLFSNFLQEKIAYQALNVFFVDFINAQCVRQNELWLLFFITKSFFTSSVFLTRAASNVAGDRLLGAH